MALHGDLAPAEDAVEVGRGLAEVLALEDLFAQRDVHVEPRPDAVLRLVVDDADDLDVLALELVDRHVCCLSGQAWLGMMAWAVTRVRRLMCL